MTIPMDNTLDLSSRERVQCLYDKTVKLEEKRRKAAEAGIPSDPSAWQQIRENYEVILLEDHSLSEKLEIEFSLWQLHYKRIEELRALLSAALASEGLSSSQNGKGPTRSGPDRITKVRSQFKIFLSEASGFYHDLMVKIRSKYGLPLGYVSYEEESQIVSKAKNLSAEVKKGLLCCHRCLIYLGDLSRYKGLYGEGESRARDFAAASSYYVQASAMWPSSGNPHHQLAILASYSGDELVATYRYFRSLAVEHPFTTARENLILAFEKNRQSYCQQLGVLGDTKASFNAGPLRTSGKGRGKVDKRASKDHRVEATLVKRRATSIPETLKAFNVCFVRLNGILFTRTSLETFGEVLSAVRSDLLELLDPGQDEEFSFGLDATECRLTIIRLIAILIFSVHNASRETENQSFAEILQRSAILQNALTAIFDLMGLIIERCIQLTDPSTNCLLSGIMVFMEWLACRQDIAGGTELEVKQANDRSSFWSSFVSLLNKLLSYEFVELTEDGDEICFSNMSQYDEDETSNRLALFEDFELRGFLPLLPAHQILDFSRKQLSESDGGKKGRKSRVQRIIAAGRFLVNVVEVGLQKIYFDNKLKRFVLGVKPQIFDQYSLPSFSPVSNGSHQESLDLLQPKAQLDVDFEEDDEVIVFKPTVSNKNSHEIPSKLSSSDVLDSGVNRSKVDLASRVASVAATSEGRSLFQNGCDTLSRPPPSLGNNNAWQPIQPNTSKWLVEQHSFAENGLWNMALLDSGFPHQYVNCTNDNKSSDYKHPPKDDDYSWLDGYNKFPSTMHEGNGHISPTVQSSEDYHPVTKISNSASAVNFPFPGKKVLPLQLNTFEQKGWSGYRFSEHLREEHQEPQLPHKGNQRSIGLPEQYQGQFLWESSFFVGETSTALWVFATSEFGLIALVWGPEISPTLILNAGDISGIGRIFCDACLVARCHQFETLLQQCVSLFWKRVMEFCTFLVLESWYRDGKSHNC